MQKYMKEYLNLSIGYPRFSRAYVSKHIDRPATSREELRAYADTIESSRSAMIIRNIVYVLSIFYFVKSISLTVTILSELDLNDLGANIRWRPEGSSYQFNCLVSNCTRLSRRWMDELKGTLIELTQVDGVSKQADDGEEIDDKLLGSVLHKEVPHFAVCHPKWSLITGVLQYMGEFGHLAALCVGFAILTDAVLLPLTQEIRLTGNLFLMFIVAPQVTRRVVTDRIEQLIEQVRDSFAITQNSFSEILSLTDVRLTMDASLVALDGQLERVLSAKSSELNGRPGHHSNNSQNSSKFVHEQRQVPDELLPSNHIIGLDETAHNWWRQDRMDEAHDMVVPNLPIFAIQRRLHKERNLSGDNKNNNSDDDEKQQGGVDELEEFVRDCTPLVRSDWWLARAARVNNVLCTVGCVNLLICSLFVIVSIPSYMGRVHERLRSFGTYLHEQANCTIWRPSYGQDDEHTELLEEIDLKTLVLFYSNAQTLLYLMICCWPFMAFHQFLVTYVLSLIELACWLHELKFELTHGREFVSLLATQGWTQPHQHRSDHSQVAWERASASGESTRAKHHQFQHFELQMLRNKFKPLARMGLVTGNSNLPSKDQLGTKSQLKSAIDTEQFACAIIQERQLGLESVIELLEKLYVSFRLFVEHMHQYERTMAIMIAYINLYIYGYILISILYLRLVADFVLMPWTLVISSWLSANLLLLFAANLHAKGKELNRLIWSLIARTSGCRNARLRHLRGLWLRQAIGLDMDGGLALMAFNVRITYTRMIQLVLGSSTLVAFALRS